MLGFDGTYPSAIVTTPIYLCLPVMSRWSSYLKTYEIIFIEDPEIKKNFAIVLTFSLDLRQQKRASSNSVTKVEVFSLKEARQHGLSMNMNNSILLFLDPTSLITSKRRVRSKVPTAFEINFSEMLQYATAISDLEPRRQESSENELEGYLSAYNVVF